MEQRIEQAWVRTKDWITLYDGAATEAYLQHVPAPVLDQALPLLHHQMLSFRADPVWCSDADAAHNERTLTLQEQSTLLRSRAIVLLNVYYTTHIDNFDFSVHLMIDAPDNDLLDIEIIWWADQAFPSGVDTWTRFSTILDHFLWLQQLFIAQRLYIGPEHTIRPGEPHNTWIEV